MPTPNWSMKTTPMVVLALLIVAGLYDLGVVVFGGTSGTISAFMVKLGFTSPFIPFVIGVLCGHFFFYMFPVSNPQNTNKE